MVVPGFSGITSIQQKDPDGMLAVAGRQILQDGSLGARAIKSLQEWHIVSDEDAHTISGTFHDGILDIYTTHCAMEKNHHVYYMNIIFTGNMRQDPSHLRQRDTNPHTSTVNNQTELSRPELLNSRSNVPKDATPKKRRLPDSKENLSLKRPKT